MILGTLNNVERALVNQLVQIYVDHLESFERLGRSLFAIAQDSRLKKKIHSTKWRTKDRDHLAEKLARKMKKAENDRVPFDIDASNLFEKINDLVGLRILHLHTDQFRGIDEILRELLAEEGFEIIEGPSARVWDSEYKALFDKIGVATQDNDRMYTSVHYIVSPKGRSIRTAEIQVRTLAEELWGEVDHLLNYPEKTEMLSLSEQIRVLARVTSSCTRLVDSIFRCKSLSHAAPEEKNGAKLT